MGWSWAVRTCRTGFPEQPRDLWDYEDELGILVVLSYANTVSSDDDDDRTNEVELCTVTLIDNLTLAVILRSPHRKDRQEGVHSMSTPECLSHLDRDVLLNCSELCENDNLLCTN